MKHMGVFASTHCSKCKKRFGWVGGGYNHPPCPRCGHKPSKEECARMDEELEEFAGELLDENTRGKQDKRD